MKRGLKWETGYPGKHSGDVMGPGFRGFPVWLRDVPNIEFRTDNAPFKVVIASQITQGLVESPQGTQEMMVAPQGSQELVEAPQEIQELGEAPQRTRELVILYWGFGVRTLSFKFIHLFVIFFQEEMQRFVTKMVNLMQQEMLFSWQGGPIIMLQVVENEYGNIENSYGRRGKDYVNWAARMALELGAGVPWVMCKQTDAPENIIDACNGFYCDGFKPNSYKKPALWTEDWNGWYASWGGRVPHRPVEDIAFAVARFFQRGGSFQNYYMVQ
ncbi:hypothetical protein HHK36_013074 [Tetracentron sinense]|uniref:beta-galactosidase n=1 Tax=Tetracentron sinense TaxID=13715 RepID=A0A835DIT1_TETSI|nr:hypothetical protein HHK36_013074 [Tetracentron sinense]